MLDGKIVSIDSYFYTYINDNFRGGYTIKTINSNPISLEHFTYVEKYTLIELPLILTLETKFDILSIDSSNRLYNVFQVEDEAKLCRFQGKKIKVTIEEIL